MDSISNLPNNFVRGSRTFPVLLAAATATQSIQRIPQMGIRFYIIDADTDASVVIKTDKTSEEFFTVGTGKEFTEDQFFTALTVENRNAFPVRLLMFAGYGDFIDKRTTIVGNRLSSILPTIEPDTFVFPVAGAVNTIAASTTVVLPGVAAGQQLRRKAVTVSNDDPATKLYINDGVTGDRICIVQPKTEIILPISGPVKVENPSAAVVSATVSEIWWMKPTPTF